MSEIYYFVLYMAFCTLYGDDFIKKIQILEFFFHLVLFHLIFRCYYCSTNLKRQSEHSGLRPDTSSPVKYNDGILLISASFNAN